MSKAAVSAALPMSIPSRVVLHIPHSSRDIPDEVRDQFVLPDTELDAELLAMTDASTDRLFGRLVPDAVEIRFSVSRLVVDPERKLDDSTEPMSRVGMGVVYERTSGGVPLRRSISARERNSLISRYYLPHHRALTNAVNAALAANAACLIVDCHSFPSVPLPYELDQRRDRPEICLGTDEFHTPAGLRETLLASFQQRGIDVALDRPFGGALVPAEHYRSDARVATVMIEVNRSLYVDEATGAPNQRIQQVHDLLAEVVAEALASSPSSASGQG